MLELRSPELGPLSLSALQEQAVCLLSVPCSRGLAVGWETFHLLGGRDSRSPCNFLHQPHPRCSGAVDMRDGASAWPGLQNLCLSAGIRKQRERRHPQGALPPVLSEPPLPQPGHTEVGKLHGLFDGQDCTHHVTHLIGLFHLS